MYYLHIWSFVGVHLQMRVPATRGAYRCGGTQYGTTPTIALLLLVKKAHPRVVDLNKVCISQIRDLVVLARHSNRRHEIVKSFSHIKKPVRSSGWTLNVSH